MAATTTTLLIFLLPLSLSATPSTASTAPSMLSDELRSLLDLISGLLVDPNWAALHPRPCTDTPWPGIQCSTAAADGERNFLHVTSIRVASCKPSASLTRNSLIHLPFLKSFSLFRCFLSPNSISLSPSIFANSSSLEHLVINSNPGLAGEIPSSVFTLRKLRVLCLSQNAFRGAIPRSLGGLRSLQQLDLSYNHLSGEVPREIGVLSSLGIVDLSSNLLQGTLPASIGSLRSLYKIDFSFNSLSERVPPELGELAKLEMLDLSHNNLSGPFPESLSGLKQLQYFLMENNPMNSSIPLFLGGLKKLQVIGLSRCGLLGEIPSFFASLVSLTALSLDRNRLDGSVPQSLGSLPKLGHLNLSQNQLSGEIAFPEEFVKRLGRRLDLRDNKGLCSRIRKNKEAFFSIEAPSCLGGISGVNEGGGFRNSSSFGHGLGCHFGPSSLWHLCFQGFSIVLLALLL